MGVTGTVIGNVIAFIVVAALSAGAGAAIYKDKAWSDGYQQGYAVRQAREAEADVTARRWWEERTTFSFELERTACNCAIRRDDPDAAMPFAALRADVCRSP